MARFEFATGNARKLLALPLYALGAAAGLLVPRSRHRWVFGSGQGIGGGALALYRHAAQADPALRLDWLARDDRDRAAAAALGIPAVVKTSPRGLWRTLRAGVVVVTHGFGDVNRFGTRGGFVVQLWHGIPLKLIQLDAPATMRLAIPGDRWLRPLLRRFYRRGYRAIDLVPAASAVVAERLRTAFGLGDDRVVVTGDPRDDVLSPGNPAAARAALFAALGTDDDGSRVLLYAPTWRDGDPDPGVPSSDQWMSLAGHLEESHSLLVLRPHPLGVGDYRDGLGVSPRIMLLGSDRVTAITPLLPAVDLVITDFSSVAFDDSLTGGPILFLAPDEAAYVNSRGLYEPYREFSGGREVRSWDALLGQLRRLDTEPAWASEVTAHSETLRDRHFQYRDGRNTERVYALVRARNGGRR
ncbi:CDP-glycerol glycerophosphotransferase family protein [soil metagenome]